MNVKGIEIKIKFSRFLIYMSTYTSHVSTCVWYVLPMHRTEEAARESKPTGFNNASWM